MTRQRILLILALAVLGFPCSVLSEPPDPSEYEIVPLNEGWAEYDFNTGLGAGTNGVLIRHGDAVLTASQASLNGSTGDVEAEGDVHVQQAGSVWMSEHIHYNFETHLMQAEQFRTGQKPLFATGADLQGQTTNKTYTATKAMITADDIQHPTLKIRAKSIRIIPGKKITAHHAVLYIGEIPVFYFPYYSRNLGEHANNFNFSPGYRSLFGPFLLANYTWYMSKELDGEIHADYRWKRGPGVGPLFNYHLGPWGEGWFRYYYTHDKDPNADELGVPIPENRQRLNFAYQANPDPTLNIKARVRYESDPAMVRDFFETEFRHNPQPSTFVEADKLWDNFSLDAYVQPRVNDFLETVERLPDIKLSAFRQQVGPTPIYYESESSAGYYRRAFAVGAPTNTSPAGLDYSAARADTYHQLVLPETFFGFLNIVPRVGGRFTYYSEASGPGGTTAETDRGVLNTGVEVSMKASKLWPEAQSDFFDVHGIRHIIEPSVNYVFVPNPSTAPSQLPQFDYELPSLRLLPIDFPDYNAIDSIDSQNVIRLGLHNRLQTKRDKQVANLVNWDLYTDWRLDPRKDQATFADLYSDFTIRPRSWLSLESVLRYDLNTGIWRMSLTSLNIQPNNNWSWGIAHLFLRDDFSGSNTALGEGENIVNSIITYRFSENWGFRMSHYFDVVDGQLRQQSYTVYRDLRSWTAALSFLLRQNRTGPEDFTVAFTFSLKAFPRLPLGGDAGGATALLGR